MIFISLVKVNQKEEYADNFTSSSSYQQEAGVLPLLVAVRTGKKKECTEL
jgi:hypothetical protein